VTVEEKGKEYLGQVALRDIRVPVEVIHHRDDGCKASPLSGARRLASELTNAQEHHLLVVDGGGDTGAECGPLNHHGYEGIEATVFASIAKFMTSH
jgi:hypothetical protein